jgi:hypothetical protein
MASLQKLFIKLDLIGPVTLVMGLCITALNKSGEQTLPSFIPMLLSNVLLNEV